MTLSRLMAATAAAIALASASHAADISFTLDRPGNVSAAIYDAQGRMVHELVRAETMQTLAKSL